MEDSTTELTQKKVHLEIPKSKRKRKRNTTAIYKYGNYDRYYGYRNTTENIKDVRLDGFQQNPGLFNGKVILDIGCNNGIVTKSIAKLFNVQQITGIDIDRKLIERARNSIKLEKLNAASETEQQSVNQYPNNVFFTSGNYILSNPGLLALETEQYDTILCLSVTKWIHLNYGDPGIKLLFQRIFKQLRPGGHLILEAQNWQSYKRRKKLTPEIFQHFKQIQLFPNKFDEYLISSDVGFSNNWWTMELLKHPSHGFQRPIKVFTKPSVVVTK